MDALRSVGACEGRRKPEQHSERLEQERARTWAAAGVGREPELRTSLTSHADYYDWLRHDS